MANNSSDLQRRIERIVAEAASAIAQAVRQSIADEVARMVGVRPGGTAAAPQGIKKKRKKARIMCPVKNCGKPGAGPKHGWFCKEHDEKLSTAEKRKARASRATKKAPA